MMATSALGDALSSRRIIVCVGAGGVGKTTVAAALALRAAALSRASLVCTIDPARRLANSLGVSELGNVERQIDTAQLRDLGIAIPATMSAMMLDMKQSWDDLIRRHAPAETAERILANRFYQTLSTRLAGSQEYIAMEKLWELDSRSDHDVIVLDTPPTAHAVDFLEAPGRLLEFLDSEASRWLLSPALLAGKVGFRLLNAGGSYILRMLSRFTGLETLQEIANLLREFGGMLEGFRERASGVRELLKNPKTGFVLVTTPDEQRLPELEHFRRLLLESGATVVAVVVNRVHVDPPPLAPSDLGHLSAALRDKVAETRRELVQMAAQDRVGMQKLATLCAGTPLCAIPRFESDVHDLPSLWRIGEYLVEAQRAQSDAVTARP